MRFRCCRSCLWCLVLLLVASFPRNSRPMPDGRYARRPQHVLDGCFCFFELVFYVRMTVPARYCCV